MKLPQHIFALTKSEQRVVVLILVALLACAVANHYWEALSHVDDAIGQRGVICATRTFTGGRRANAVSAYEHRQFPNAL
jgi:hypothetical protein